MKRIAYMVLPIFVGCGFSFDIAPSEKPSEKTVDGCPITSVGRLEPTGTCQSFEKETLLAQLSAILDNPTAHGFSQADVDAFLRDYGLENASKSEVLEVAERFIDEGYPHRHAATILALNPKTNNEFLVSIDSPDGFVSSVTSGALDIVSLGDGGEAALTYSLKSVANLQLTEPLVSLSFVLDYSGSMYECDLAYVERAITKITDALPLVYEASLFKFNQRVCELTPFTDASDVFNDALLKQIQRGSTALYDGLVAGANEMVEARGRYRFVIGVTDGMENASSASNEDVLKSFTTHRATALLIGLGQVDIFNLNRIATDSNGYLFYVPASQLLEVVANSVVEAISTAHVVTLQRPLEPGEVIEIRYKEFRKTFSVPTTTSE